MAEILLSSENYIKSILSLSDNTSPKYILSSLREAQEISLKSIIGPAMVDRLKEMVKESTIRNAENAMYRQLLDRCQLYLAYKTIVEMIYKVSYKIGNAGVVKASDENMQVASLDEIIVNKEFYQGKADSFTIDIQQFILDNRASFPEVDENCYRRIHANLYSAASCGIFLGGPRGRRKGR